MKKFWIFWGLLLYAVLAASPLVAQSISISVGESSVQLRTGGPADTFGVTVSRTNFTGSVTLALSGLPAGVDTTIVQPDTGNSGSITLQAGIEATAVNNQTVTVTASGANVAPATATFLLTVIEARVRITALSATTVTLTTGGASQTINVTLARSNFVGNVALSVSGLPTGVTATIIQPGAGNFGAVTLRAAGNATLVTSQSITITASGEGAGSGTATFLLTVNNVGIVLNLAEPAVNLTAGGSAQTLTITLTRINFTGSVTLSLGPLPAGITATISQPGQGNSGAVVLQASPEASFINQSISLTASGSGIVSVTTTFQLIVTVSGVRITSVSESPVILTAGGPPRTIQVALSRTNFFENVTLGVSALPAGVVATFSQPGTVNAGSITLQASSAAAPVTRQTVTISANSGENNLATATFLLTVNTSGVTISFLSEGSVSLAAGGAAQTVSLTITRINFTGSVTLTASGLPAGVTATFNQPGTSDSGAFTLQASSSASTSNQFVTITASGTGITPATTTLNLVVIAARIRITLTPASVTVTAGLAPQAIGVAVSRSDFSGPVTLSVSNLPAGLEATISQPGTGNSGSISLRAGAGATPVTNHALTVTAVDGGVPVTATLAVTVASGGIAISPLSESSLTLLAGGIAQPFDVTIQRANFAGSVTLSVNELPAGVTASFVQPGPGNFGSIVLQATNNAASVFAQTVTITASSSGVASATTTFLLTITVAASSVSFDPNPVTGGNTTVGTVTLSGLAPATGISVSLGSNSALVQVPATATISANTRSGTFALTTARVNDTQNVIVTATLNGTAQGTLVVVQELRVNVLSFQPNPVTEGGTATGTITLSGLAPAGGARVTLQSNNPIVQVPASVTVPEGRNTATFTATTGRLGSRLEVLVTATLDNSTIATLTLVPATGPSFTVEGITNAASFVTGITPGSIVTIFGTTLTRDVTGVVSAPSVFPLPTELRGTSVTVNGIAAPLFAIVNVSGREQINLQVPFEVAGQATVTLVVNNNGVTSAPVQATLLTAHPGVFTVDGTAGVIVHSNFQLVSASSPAARDEVVVAYATGLGPVSQTPRTGTPALRSPLSLSLLTPTVTVGGIAAEVLFSGLAPDFAGLYQVNFRVPTNAPTGSVDVVIQVSGQNSKPVKLAVQ